MRSPLFTWDERPGRQCWNCAVCGCDVMFGSQCRGLPPRGVTRAVGGCGEWERVRSLKGRLGAWRVKWSHHA